MLPSQSISALIVQSLMDEESKLETAIRKTLYLQNELMGLWGSKPAKAVEYKA